MFNWEHLDIIVGVVTKGLFWTVVISVTSIVIGYFIGLATGFSRARNIRILKSISAFLRLDHPQYADPGPGLVHLFRHAKTLWHPFIS